MIKNEKRRFTPCSIEGKERLALCHQSRIHYENRTGTNRNVIVFLTGEDLAYYDLTFRLLDAKGIATRRMAAELLSRIQEQTGIDFTKTRILIEAYPNGEGCILRIGPVVHKTNGRKTIPGDLSKPGGLSISGTRKPLSRQPKCSTTVLPERSAAAPFIGRQTAIGSCSISSFPTDSLLSLRKNAPITRGRASFKRLYAIEYGKPIAFSNALSCCLECCKAICLHCTGFE